MDAPLGRYRIVEKGRRLVVIDTATGSSVSSPAPVEPRANQGQPGTRPVAFPRAGARRAAPRSASSAEHPLDRISALLLRLALRERRPDGSALVRWNWEQNGQPRQWHATLDAGQQRRLGRALLAMAGVPLLFVLATILSAGALAWLGIFLIPGPLLWGMAAIGRLQRETADQPPPAGGAP